MKIFESAIANWPEDEAFAMVSDWRDMTPENGYSPEDCNRIKSKDMERMESIFLREGDGQELIARFRAAIVKYTEEEA